MRKMNKYRILLGTIFLVLLSLGGFYLGRQYQNSSKCTTCTEEAKLCPDGSYVSRTGPNCEFTTCPAQQPYSTIGETANWKTYTGPGLSFSYPSNFIVSQVTKKLSGNLIFSTILVFSTLKNDKLAENFYIEIGKQMTDKKNVFELAKEFGIGEFVKIGKNDALYVGPDTERGDYTYSLVNKGVMNSLTIDPAVELQEEKFNTLKVTIDRILSTFQFLDQSLTSQECGGWDTGGEIVCDCSGRLIRPTCPPGAMCDKATYTCEGVCGQCCYKGIAENVPYPKCK